MTIEEANYYIESLTTLKWGIYREWIHTHLYLSSDINKLMNILKDNNIRYDFEINSKSTFDIYTFFIKKEDMIPYIRVNKINELLTK